MNVESASVRPYEMTDRGPTTFGPAPFAARCLLTVIVFLAFSIPFAALASPPKESFEETPAIEKKLTAFIKQFFGDEEDLQVKFNNIPEYLKGSAKVKSISFARVPDGQGNGLCLVEFAAKDVRERNAYVGFRVFKKKALFLMKREGKRGDVITASDLAEKDTFLTGATSYPASREEVVGKKLRKDLPAGTVLTTQMLEEQVMVRSGEIVSVVVDNPRLAIHTSGKALERGRLGDTVRVKNLTSGKEIYGKVTGTSTVTVEF